MVLVSVNGLKWKVVDELDRRKMMGVLMRRLVVDEVMRRKLVGSEGM